MTRTLKICLGLLLALTFMMLFSALQLRAAEDGDAQSLSYCQAYGFILDPASAYADFDLSAEDTMALYHEKMNEKFNEYIKMMITTETTLAAANNPDQAKKGQPPERDENGNYTEGLNEKTGIPNACTGNYSTFCVALTLLKDPIIGHMSYRNALNCRKIMLFDTRNEVEDFKSYSDALVLGEENEKDVAQVYQSQIILENSSRIQGIETELRASKQALDQTLSAYNELRTAWPMHKQYVEIYKNLLKYRDKLVEIRHQVEEYPSKFIDVTTTSCT